MISGNSLPSLDSPLETRVRRLRRYYQVAKTSRCSSRFVSFSFTRRYHVRVQSFLRTNRLVLYRRLGVVHPVLLSGTSHGNNGTSLVPASPQCSYALFQRPRMERPPRPLQASGVAPDQHKHKGSKQVIVFRGSIARHLSSLSTLHVGGCPTPCKTRFRRLVKPYRAGSSRKKLDERF